jgi:hypothetical protein
VCRVGRTTGVRADAGWWATRVAEGAGDEAMGGPSGERRGKEEMGHRGEGLGQLGHCVLSSHFLFLSPSFT